MTENVSCMNGKVMRSRSIEPFVDGRGRVFAKTIEATGLGIDLGVILKNHLITRSP